MVCTRNMSLFARILKNSSQSVLSGVAGAVGSFAAAAVVARTLGVAGTASVGMALWIVFVTTTLADIGITGALSRFVSVPVGEEEPDRQKILLWWAFKVFAVAIVAGLTLTGLFLWLYWGDILSKYATSPAEARNYAIAVLACFVVHMLFAYCYQMLRGLRAFNTLTRTSLIGTVCQITVVILGSRWFGVVGAIAAYITYSLPLLWSLTRVRPTKLKPSPHDRARMRGYALTFYGSALFSPLLWVRFDVIVVDQLQGAQAVGLFIAAATIAALLLGLSQMICNALLPNIVHAATDGEDALRRASSTAVRFALFLLLPMGLIGAAAAPQIIKIVYGAAFVPAAAASVLLCLAAAASMITLVISAPLNAADANTALARSGIVGAVLTVGLGVPLIWYGGIIGAGVARLLAQSTVAMLNIAALNRRLKGVVRLAWLLPMMLSAAGAALIMFGVNQLGLGLGYLVLGGGLACLAYAGLSLFTLKLAANELGAAAMVVERLPGPLSGFGTRLLTFMSR